MGASADTITNSNSSGAVTSFGSNSVVGGLVGTNGGSIVSSNSSGPVMGTSESYLGGLVGLNLGLIQNSFTALSSTVTGTGSHNFAGGLAGFNFGFIDPTRSAGDVTSGPDSVVGSFVGANGAVLFSDGSTVIGTVSPDSFGTGSASDGAGSTGGSQVGQNYPIAGLRQFCPGIL